MKKIFILPCLVIVMSSSSCVALLIPHSKTERIGNGIKYNHKSNIVKLEKEIQFKYGPVGDNGKKNRSILSPNRIQNKSQFEVKDNNEDVLMLVTKHNIPGLNDYLELKFIKENKKVEIGYLNYQSLIRFIIDNKLIVNGQLKSKKIEELVEVYGENSYSTLYKDLKIDVNQSYNTNYNTIEVD
jgi:hypothetical protein